jgi:hypothetical protein
MLEKILGCLIVGIAIVLIFVAAFIVGWRDLMAGKTGPMYGLSLKDRRRNRK